MPDSQRYITALDGLASKVLADVAEIRAGLVALASLPVEQAGQLTTAPQSMRDAMAATIRALYGPMTAEQWTAIEAVLDGQSGLVEVETAAALGLNRADFDWAAAKLQCTYAQIRAVDEVESGGGWFTDVRADILALDGEGGFLTGPHLPKILFEAHKFDEFTGGRFRGSHPNLSSAKWNAALYVGGQAEYGRLHRAMQLDETAALKSASWGRYQIMGFNHRLAGYGSVQAFVAGMKESERKQLEAFVSFILNSGLGDELRRVSNVHADCVPFARGYNGPGYAKNDYHVKIAQAHKKYAAS